MSPFEPTHASLTVQVDDLRHALSYVQAALPSGNDPRGYFNGVLFQFDEKALTLVGSDGVMLAVIRLGVRGPAGRSWIVPTRSVAELLKLLRATSAKTLSLTLGAARLRLQLDRVSLTLACLDAVYPSWATALKRAKDGAHTIHASASAFLGACERVSLVARDDRRVQLTYSPGQVMLNTEKGGQAAEEKLTVQCEHNGVVVFDRAQLRVAAAAVAGETISLRLGGSSGPALISGEAKTQCYVLSPIKQ